MNFIESVRKCCFTFIAFPFHFNYMVKMIHFQVFSFVFGDGDPNQGLEEERWKLVLFYFVLFLHTKWLIALAFKV